MRPLSEAMAPPPHMDAYARSLWFAQLLTAQDRDLLAKEKKPHSARGTPTTPKRSASTLSGSHTPLSSGRRNPAGVKALGSASPLTPSTAPAPLIASPGDSPAEGASSQPQAQTVSSPLPFKSPRATERSRPSTPMSSRASVCTSPPSVRHCGAHWQLMCVFCRIAAASSVSSPGASKGGASFVFRSNVPRFPSFGPDNATNSGRVWVGARNSPAVRHRFLIFL